MLTALAIISGTGFYSLVEGLRLVDALYLSVITLTTVGYGDLAPETDAGKLFTIAYAFIGIGILLSLITTLAARTSQVTALHRRETQPTREEGDAAPHDHGTAQPPPGASR